jgi:FtsP/CotA-like multicopper oxidase with cupredoxin domain
MTGKALSRSLVLLASLILVPAAIQAQPADCGVPPNGRPWGCELRPDHPPSINPVGDVLDTTLVIREKDLYVPVFTATLCKGTLKVCIQDADCGAGVPKGTCANAKTCTNNPSQSCSANSDCGQDAECVQAWGWQLQHLRPYGSPIDPRKPIDHKNPEDPNLRWGYPGPILRARATTLKDPTQPPGKSNPVQTPGTRLKVKLHNHLPKQSYDEAMHCNPASYNLCTNRVCSTTTTKICTQNSDCPSGETCNPAAICSQYVPCADPQGPCGAPIPVTQEHPNCFHGNNVTNLHLHGTHVSPQPHQDYVLLSLFPYDSTGVPPNDPRYAVGEYQVDVNPLPWNQAPGTHWYHPHKHGSTSLQVLGGQAGGLMIEGAFDDWLKKLYGGQLVDRLMAVQQINSSNNFFNFGKPNVPPAPLLNGYATPTILMQPGEIQRWRFVGGTTQAAAALEIGFDPRITEVRQIAQDGVQFAWQNYDRQPLRDSEGTYLNFELPPGNRADFLIKAPDQPGSYAVTHRVFLPQLTGNQAELFNRDDEDITERVPPTAIPEGTAPVDQNGNPLLFVIKVAGSPKPMSFPVTEATDPACKTSPCPKCPGGQRAPATAKPDRCWPDTPYYLCDLCPPGGEPTKIAFSINGEPASQPNSFYINNQQYQPDCAGVTMPLGATQDWLVSNVLGQNNAARLPHPFHIHINPFQVIRNSDRTFDPPYVWQDTIALPVPAPAADELAGPIWNNDDAKVKCPRACQADNATWNGQWTTTVPGKMSVCGCVVNSDSVSIRQRYDDYTGAYVIHCHFLGHEDRGMMWNVQTVCNPSSLKFGAPQTNGGPDNCGQTSDALKRCTTAAN